MHRINILRPIELKRSDLLRVANCLSKNGVTKIVIHRGDDVQYLSANMENKLHMRRHVAKKLVQKRAVTKPQIVSD